MLFSAYLELDPVAKGRPRMTRRGHVFTPEKTKNAEATIQVLLKRLFKGAPLTGPLMVYLFFMVKKPKKTKNQFPVVKPDLDNFAKLVLDAANEIIWQDDSQVVQIHMAKVYADIPGIVLGVNEFTLECLTELVPVFDHLSAHEGEFLKDASVNSQLISALVFPQDPQ